MASSRRTSAGSWGCTARFEQVCVAAEGRWRSWPGTRHPGQSALELRSGAPRRGGRRSPPCGRRARASRGRREQVGDPPALVRGDVPLEVPERADQVRQPDALGGDDAKPSSAVQSIAVSSCRAATASGLRSSSACRARELRGVPQGACELLVGLLEVGVLRVGRPLARARAEPRVDLSNGGHRAYRRRERRRRRSDRARPDVADAQAVVEQPAQERLGP